MVAFFGFFEECEVFIEHLLFGECDAVYAHELVAFFVAAPVSTCEGCDFHRLDGCSVGDVRAAAEVGE